MGEKIHRKIIELLILLNVSIFAENMIKWKQTRALASIVPRSPRREGPGNKARNILQSL